MRRNDNENIILATLKMATFPIHKAGYPFIIAFMLVTVGLFLLWNPLGWIGSILTFWCAYFFRDPDRIVPEKAGLIISPADGVVHKIEEVAPPSDLNMGDEPLTRISVFLNVFNVHINRIPIAGKITALHYHPGKFLNASLEAASEENEQQIAVVTTEDGVDIIFVQIAGLVARRIICNLEDNQEVKTGERFGLIRFGSRADIYLPKGVNPKVIVGQTMIGGETILANLKSKEKARTGKKI